MKTNLPVICLLLFFSLILASLTQVSRVCVPAQSLGEETQESLEDQGMIAAPINSPEDTSSVFSAPSTETVTWDPDWEYASYSAIHTGSAVIYRAPFPNGITVCINAGHGTAGGSGAQTLCHPDGTAKVTGGSTAAGATYATAVSEGTTMLDGTSEAYRNLELALLTKEKLLAAGYHVLMIRETEDVQLDNVARTVMANQNADCHLALHYDSTDNNKGFFYIGVPNVASYRAMEPVASCWQEHIALGESILSGMREAGCAIYGNGSMDIDLTQTSYSTIPSVDLECGDRASDCSDAAQEKLADGIVRGLNLYFDR